MIYIETERLILRELCLSDDEGMFALDADPEVLKYLYLQPVTHIEQSRQQINFIRQQYIDNGIGRWAVIEKRSNEFVGWSGLKLIKDTINNRTNFYDIGYRLLPQYWGNGYATESAVAAVKYGFKVLQTDTLYGRCAVDNVASKKVLEKSGLYCLGQFDLNGIQHYWFEMKNDL